jgi:hypothetical protein
MHVPLVKLFHLLGDRFEVILDSEVTGLQPVHLRLRQVFEIGFTACRRKENITLAPKDNGLWLMPLQERLPLAVKFHIGPIIVKEVELDTLGIGTRQKVVVHVPVVGTN